jgi:signal transduction histidine kinase
MFVNDAIERVLGFNPGEWYAHATLWEEQVHPADVQSVLDKRERSYRQGVTFRSEYRMFTRGGVQRWLREQSRGVQTGEGVAIVGVAIDVSDLMWSGDLVGRWYDEQKALVADLRRIRDRLETFTRLVAHDARAPLAGAREMVLELAADTGTPAVDREGSLALIASRLQQLERLMEHVSTMSGSGGTARDLGELSKDVDLRVLVGDVLNDLDVEHHDVRTAIDDARISVRPGTLERILRNLVVNAATHTPPGCTVTVSARRAPEGVLVSVEDDGPGVPAHLRETIFEPFDRGTAADSTTGLGLGLSLVRRLTEMLDGRVWVEDRPGGGAAFRVLLPTSSLA